MSLIKTSLPVLIIFISATILINVPGREGISFDQLAGDKETLGVLLPKEVGMGGQRDPSSPEFFDAENLWRYINGQAEMYLDYGFELLATSNYTYTDSSGFMTIEIYQMKGPNHAFGIYAAERSPNDKFINMGVQGYLEANVLNFWKGPYYVKLSSSQSPSNAKKTLMKVASVIADKIMGSYSEPELFAYFPEKDKITMSERFIPDNFLGQAFLKNGYRVSYRNGGISYQVFLVKYASREQAEEAFWKYQNFFKSQNEIFL